jgi:hypothetical protein
VIRELLPLAAYVPAQQTSNVRMALMVAVLWGVPVTVIVLLPARDIAGIATGLAIGAAGALAFGFLWTYLFTRAMRKIMRRIYEGDPRVVPPAPAGEYGYRLMCNYMISPRLAVGGHLYVGPRELTFVPHHKNLRRHRAPLSIPTTPEPVIESVAVAPGRTTRLLGAGPSAYQLQVRTSGIAARFVAPEPEHVAERLREYVRTAQGG